MTDKTELSKLTPRHLEVREMFDTLITAFGQKDFKTFAEYFTEESIFEFPYKPLDVFPDMMHGIDEFLSAAEFGMSSCTPYGHTVDQFYDQLDPDSLVVEYHTDCTHIPTQKRYANKYLGLVRFEGRKVTWWKEYVNPLPVLEVYGDDFENSALGV